MLSVFGWNAKLCCGACPGLPLHEDAAPARSGARSAVSGDQVEMDRPKSFDDYDEVFNESLTVDIGTDATKLSALDVHPQISSRTPLKADMGSELKPIERPSAWRTILQSAWTPKVMCHAACFILMACICTIGVMSQGSVHIATFTTTSTTSKIGTTESTAARTIISSTLTTTTTLSMHTTTSARMTTSTFLSTAIEGVSTRTTTSTFLSIATEAAPRAAHAVGDHDVAVGLVLTLEGIDYKDLAARPEMRGVYEAEIARAIAAQAGHGTLPREVHLHLTEGSSVDETAVWATIAVANSTEVGAVWSELRSSLAVQTAVKSVLANMSGAEDLESVSISGVELAHIGTTTATSPDTSDATPLPSTMHANLWGMIVIVGASFACGMISVCTVLVICLKFNASASSQNEEANHSNARYLRRDDWETAPPSTPLASAGTRPGVVASSWMPVLPDSPQRVPDSEALPPMAPSILETEWQQDDEFQRKKAEFNLFRAARDMGFTETESRTVLEHENGNFEVALATLEQMCSIDPSLAGQ